MGWGSCGQGGPGWVREVLWGPASPWRVLWGRPEPRATNGAGVWAWREGAGQRGAGPRHRIEGCREVKLRAPAVSGVRSGRSLAPRGGSWHRASLGSGRNPRWLDHGCGAGRSLVTPVPLPWTLRAGIARRALPARSPPLASGRGVGGARGRHECATAASSHSRTHPSRLLAVAVATSRRWGIYRGELRSVGRTGLGGCLPGQPPASFIRWVGAQAVLFAGCRPSRLSHLGAAMDLRVEIKNKYPCCSPLLRAPEQAALVLAGLCRAGLLLCWNKQSLVSDAGWCIGTDVWGKKS